MAPISTQSSKSINNIANQLSKFTEQTFEDTKELRTYLQNTVLSKLSPLMKIGDTEISEFSNILKTLIDNMIKFLDEYIKNSKKDLLLLTTIKQLESMIKSQSYILGESRGLANQLSSQERRVTHEALAMPHTYPYPPFQSPTNSLQLQQQFQQQQLQQLLQELLKQRQSGQSGQQRQSGQSGQQRQSGQSVQQRQSGQSGQQRQNGQAGGNKSIQLFNIEFKKLLIKVDNINDNIKLSINEKNVRIKKLFNQFEKKIKTQINKMKKETTNVIKLLKLKQSKPRKKTVLKSKKSKKSKSKPRKKRVLKPKKSKSRPRKKTVSKTKKI